MLRSILQRFNIVHILIVLRYVMYRICCCVRRRPVQADNMSHNDTSSQHLPEASVDSPSNAPQMPDSATGRHEGGNRKDGEWPFHKRHFRTHTPQPKNEVQFRRSNSEPILSKGSSGPFRDSSLSHTSRLPLDTPDNASLEPSRSRERTLNRMVAQSKQRFQVAMAADGMIGSEQISTIHPNTSRAPVNPIPRNQSAAQWPPKATIFGSDAVGAARATNAQRAEARRGGPRASEWHESHVYVYIGNEEAQSNDNHLI